MTSKELTIRQIGEWCTNTHCHKCLIKKWNDESGRNNVKADKRNKGV